MEDIKCPICWDEFSESGDNLPRLLPCSHTACHKCLGRQMRRACLTCAECRKKHRAPRRADTFPQNKYVLDLMKVLKKQKTEAENKPQKEKSPFKQCPEHKRDLSLHCKSIGCDKEICQLCLLEGHIGHDLIDISEDRKEALQLQITQLTKQSNRYRKKLLSTRQKVQDAGVDSLENLENRKNEQMKLFDEMIQRAKEGTTEVEQDIDRNLKTVDEQLIQLNQIRSQLENTGTVGNREAEAVKEAEERMKRNKRTYPFFRYDDTECSPKCGRLMEEVMHLPMLHVTSTFVTQDTSTYYMEVLSNGTIVVCELDADGDLENKYKLTQYDAQGKVLLSKKTGENCPFDMVEVSLAGKQCLAMSYKKERKIDFFDVDSLDEIVCSYSVAPHDPDRMCCMSPSTLLYVDKSAPNRKVRWLDCSELPPKPAERENAPQTKEGSVEGNILDLCCVQSDHKDTLVTLQINGKISAHNMETDDLEWSVTGQVRGVGQGQLHGVKMNACSVTADEQGHLFTCDYDNECIQMFSTDGKYLGPVTREGEQGIKKPWWIRWSKKLSSLVVAHGDDEISVIKTYL